MTTKTTQSRRTIKTTATKKTAARRTTAPKTTARKTKPVDLRKPLTTREATDPEFITKPQIDAAHALALAGLRLPIRAWTTNPDGTATLHYRTGAQLHYQPATVPPITAITPCARGAHHIEPIHTAADLHRASHRALNCRAHHDGPIEWPEMVHLRPLAPTTSPAGIPEPAIQHDPDATHEMDVRELRAALDTDEAPKEHPEP